MAPKRSIFGRKLKMQTERISTPLKNKQNKPSLLQLQYYTSLPPCGGFWVLQSGASLAWNSPLGRKCSSSSSSNGSLKLRTDSEHNRCHSESWGFNNARIVAWFRKRLRRVWDSVTCSDGQSRNPQSVCGAMLTGFLLSVCDNTADLLTPGIPSSACLTRAKRIR